METPASNPYQAPSSPVADTGGSAVGEKMSVKDVYLSFEGRIPRKVFWLYYLAVYIPVLIIMGIAGAISHTLMLILAVPIYIGMIWIGLALSIKRWHDRDKSGWWVLIVLIPLIGPLWALVEAGCLRGTVGGNRFGGDPTDAYDEKLF